MFATLLLAALPSYIADTAIFERVEVADELVVTTFGVIEDSRCNSPRLCFDDDRLIVAAIVRYQGREREYAIELGAPIYLDDGVLLLAGTATPPREGGAIHLKDYRLDWAFEPYAEE
ncbi:hypothetical protein P7228_12920 [Altererythrobacter arenosus]|uniref:DUF2155 domain-containing protein n=1 Tax=Altererythrobacter arenosus TaxID=3032592 RepID=A0ABY8FPF3_9SPHN|nr:hypothetical protein [Altererythrobacter sp. CAU 1644]WFL76886.1 hypothetical protein P7228_12920 [Altererythrobacter sp. CAU 1644]